MPKLSVLLLLLFVACSKQNGSGLVVRVNQPTPPQGPVAITAAQLDSVQILFLANQLPIDNLRADYYVREFNMGKVHEQVGIQQFYKGFPIYNQYQYLNFYDKVIDSLSVQSIYNGVPANPDTTAHFTPQQVRQIFLDSDPDSYTYEKKDWAKTKLEVSLNFFDGSYLDSTRSNFTGVLYRAWEIHPSGDPHPLAFISDEDGKLRALLFFNFDPPVN